jgi:glycosyltransferase involved in cell wall biosynthesis
MNPLISIITVSFNSGKTIRATIESLLNQEFTNFEYIIIDGNSTDNTLEIIKSYENKFALKNVRYKYTSEPDSGIYNAFNKGLNLINGNWVAFLGSDDYYLPEALSYYNTAITKKPNVDFIYASVYIINKEKTIKKINETWSWAVFKRYMNIPHVGSLHNINYFKKYGFFDESYSIAADYELLLRANKNLKTFKVNEITVKMLDGGASNKSVLKAFKETFKAKNKTGKINFFTCLFDYSLAVSKFYTKKILRAYFR